MNSVGGCRRQIPVVEPTAVKRDTSHGPVGFPSTRWSRLCGSGEAGTGDLESFCRDYWHPVHAFLRSRFGLDGESAKDRAQDFFVHLLERVLWSKADRQRGSFRAFLKKALNNYMTDQVRAGLALKRGGGRKHVSLEEIGEHSGELTDPGSASADQVLDREWRRQLVGRAMAEVQAELEQEGRAVYFRVFEDYFLGPEGEVDYRQLSDRYELSTHDVSNYLRVAKQRYRTRLRQMVMDTVFDREDLDAELAWLFGTESSQP